MKTYYSILVILITCVLSNSIHANPLIDALQPQYNNNYKAQSSFNTSPTTDPSLLRPTTKSLHSIDKQSIESTSEEILSNIQAIFSSNNPSSTAITQEQQDALIQISNKTPRGIDAKFNHKDGSLTLIRPSLQKINMANKSKSNPMDNAAIGNAFFNEYQTLLKLDSPSDSFVLNSQSKDQQRLQHLHYAQSWQGIPVWGKQVKLHLDADNRVYQFNGHYSIATMPNTTNYTLNPEDANEIAKADLKVIDPYKIESSLVIYPLTTKQNILSYKVTSEPTAGHSYLHFIDANTGKIIHKIHNTHTGSVVSSSGLNLSNKRVYFNSWLDNGSYYLLDPTFPLNDVNSLYNPINNGLNTRGDTIILDSRSLPSKEDLSRGSYGSQLYYTGSSKSDSGWDATAVTVMQYSRLIYDYYKNEHNRNSFDDNSMNIEAVIHFGEDYAQAAWSGGRMYYGDGDGVNFKSFARCFDIAAHEMTHGVIEHSANLIYENQSGALNESFADIFAVLMDDDNWLIGEDCTIQSPGFIRDMQTPSRGQQPSKFSQYKNLPNTPQGDNGGVHINSGIPNHAFYLLAKKIGREPAGKIYYRALTTYLTSSATFIDARRATEQAASDLYGAGTQVNAVRDAWDQVEVTENQGQPDNTAPTSTDAVNGDDVLAYLLPQTNTPNSYNLYRKVFNSNTVRGPLNSKPARRARPSLFTLPEGTYTTYVSTDMNLHLIFPDSTDRALSSSGTINTATVSPNGRYIAYVTNSATDDNIHVLDINTSTTTDYPIYLTSFQEGQSSTSAKVRYADSLNFDYSSEKIIFDMLICVPKVNDPCTAGSTTGQNYWSIGTLDLANNGKVSIPFPAQQSNVNLGFPMFANNNNYIITMDVVLDDVDSYIYGAVTYNFETQNLAEVYTDSNVERGFFSSPSFWGDDDYISFASIDNKTYKIAVSEQSSWEASSNRELINSTTAILPTQFRAGVRSINKDLVPSESALDFGTVTRGQTKSLSLTLENTGNSDINISNISLSSDQAFSHNGVNLRIPQAYSYQIDIHFRPTSDGRFNANLIINSNAGNSNINIPLSAEGTLTASDGGFNNNSSSGGGAAFGLLLIAAILRRRQLTTLVSRH